MHVTASSEIDIPKEYENNIINASSYPDIQELYLITDILITDYSSVLFDFAVMERPIIFYAYDLEEYKNDIRGAYLDYEQEVPGKIVKSQKELFDAIEKIETLNLKYKDKLSEFKDKYAPLDDGNASNRIVKKILLD
jgi:CDP-glycerol glycerophosphotransferase